MACDRLVGRHGRLAGYQVQDPQCNAQPYSETSQRCNNVTTTIEQHHDNHGTSNRREEKRRDKTRQERQNKKGKTRKIKIVCARHTASHFHTTNQRTTHRILQDK